MIGYFLDWQSALAAIGLTLVTSRAILWLITSGNPIRKATLANLLALVLCLPSYAIYRYWDFVEAGLFSVLGVVVFTGALFLPAQLFWLAIDIARSRRITIRRGATFSSDRIGR